MFRKKFKLSLIGLFGVALIALCTAAGVNGIFNSVTSSLGYQVAGAAGVSGNALCSDGTRYSTACPLYYQTIYSGGTPQTQEPNLGFTATDFALSNVLGPPAKTVVSLASVGTPGTYANPSSITTDAQGRVSSITAGTTPAPQLLPNYATCTPATSTDADCTGTVALSPGWSDTSYTISAQPLSTFGAHLTFTVTGKSNGSFTYIIACAFNCSSYGTMSTDVSTSHN